MVDGPSVKWCKLLLLDALCYLLLNDHLRTSTKRTFNHQRVLYDAVQTEIFRVVDEEAQKELSVSVEMQLLDQLPGQWSWDPAAADPKESLLRQIDQLRILLPELCLTSVCAPWDQLRALQDAVAASPPNKSRAKYLRSALFFTSFLAPLLRQQTSMEQLLQAAVLKVGFVSMHFQEHRRGGAVHTLAGIPLDMPCSAQGCGLHCCALHRFAVGKPEPAAKRRRLSTPEAVPTHTPCTPEEVRLQVTCDRSLSSSTSAPRCSSSPSAMQSPPAVVWRTAPAAITVTLPELRYQHMEKGRKDAHELGEVVLSTDLGEGEGRTDSADSFATPPPPLPPLPAAAIAPLPSSVPAPLWYYHPTDGLVQKAPRPAVSKPESLLATVLLRGSNLHSVSSFWMGLAERPADSAAPASARLPSIPPWLSCGGRSSGMMPIVH